MSIYQVEVILAKINSATLFAVINLAESLGAPFSSPSSESIRPSPSLSIPSFDISIESP